MLGFYLLNIGSTCFVSPPSNSLLALLPSDHYISNWSQAIAFKIKSLGIDLDSLANYGESHIFQTIKRIIQDVDVQGIHAGAGGSFSPRALGLSYIPNVVALYFSNLTIPSCRTSFMLARLNVFPSAMVEGRYRKIPHIERTCRYSSMELDTICHILL